MRYDSFERGITLIELLVVVRIVGILAAVAMWPRQNLGQGKLAMVVYSLTKTVLKHLMINGPNERDE